MKTLEQFITVKQEDRWNVLYIGEMAVSKFKIGSYAGTQNLEYAKKNWLKQLEKIAGTDDGIKPSHFHQHPDNSYSPCECR